MRSDSTNKFRPDRVLIRVFVLAMTFVMLLDITPWGTLPSDLPKKCLVQLTCRLGIEQGQWTMFAPNPAMRTCWWTAEITDSRGNREDWAAPYWAISDGRQKFLQYRHMIFDDRLSWPNYHPATTDFANYLARTSGCGDANLTAAEKSKIKVVLYSNTLDLIPPDDGHMPTPDNITFLAASEAIARSD